MGGEGVSLQGLGKDGLTCFRKVLASFKIHIVCSLLGFSQRILFLTL